VNIFSSDEDLVRVFSLIPCGFSALLVVFFSHVVSIFVVEWILLWSYWIWRIYSKSTLDLLWWDYVVGFFPISSDSPASFLRSSIFVWWVIFRRRALFPVRLYWCFLIWVCGFWRISASSESDLAVSSPLRFWRRCSTTQVIFRFGSLFSGAVPTTVLWDSSDFSVFLRFAILLLFLVFGICIWYLNFWLSDEFAILLLCCWYLVYVVPIICWVVLGICFLCQLLFYALSWFVLGRLWRRWIPRWLRRWNLVKRSHKLSLVLVMLRSINYTWKLLLVIQCGFGSLNRYTNLHCWLQTQSPWTIISLQRRQPSHYTKSENKTLWVIAKSKELECSPPGQGFPWVPV